MLAAVGLPQIPNPTFALTLTAQPNAGLILIVAPAQDNIALGNGCTQYLDPASAYAHGFVAADAGGSATTSVPIPNIPVFGGAEFSWQAVEMVPGGPLFGSFAVSNGLSMRVGWR